MLNEQYRKSLNRYKGRYGIVLYALLSFSPLFLAIMGCLNLWLASRVGVQQGIVLSDYAQMWFEEINIQREYHFSGLFLVGMHRFNTALLQFSVALMLSPLAWGVIFRKKRDHAVVEALRKYGEI